MTWGKVISSGRAALGVVHDQDFDVAYGESNFCHGSSWNPYLGRLDLSTDARRPRALGRAVFLRRKGTGRVSRGGAGPGGGLMPDGRWSLHRGSPGKQPFLGCCGNGPAFPTVRRRWPGRRRPGPSWRGNCGVTRPDFGLDSIWSGSICSAKLFSCRRALCGFLGVISLGSDSHGQIDCTRRAGICNNGTYRQLAGLDALCCYSVSASSSTIWATNLPMRTE